MDASQPANAQAHYRSLLEELLQREPGLFLYVVLDKARANLAMARRKVADVEAELAV